MIDNLEDAISHAKEVVEEKREEVKYWNNVKGVGVFTDANTKHLLNKCEECAKEHEQLADWLTELSDRREADKKLKETLEDMSERLKDSLFGDGIRFALKVMDESRKRDSESEDK